LIASAHRFDPEIQPVLSAGAPDTPQIAKQRATAIRALQAARPGVFWLDATLTLDEVKQVLPPRRRSAAHRCTSRWASSTWTRWHAAHR